MTEIKLSARLQAAADMALRGEDINKDAADIGTDHALLPVYLCQKGCPRAFASDINEGPTDRARANIAKYGLSDKITAARRDGLDGIESFAPGVIIICGMGGELIADIISRSDYPSASRCRLVLQPMSMQDKLRRFLAGNGYAIYDETVVYDDGKYYQLISAEYDGKPYAMTDAEYRLGRLNIARISGAQSIADTDRGWLTKVRAAAKRRIEGRRGAEKIDQSGQASDEELVSLINKLIN